MAVSKGERVSNKKRGKKEKKEKRLNVSPCVTTTSAAGSGRGEREKGSRKHRFMAGKRGEREGKGRSSHHLPAF